MELSEIQINCGAIARSKGFWEAHENMDPVMAAAYVKLALIHSEVTEATEALRDLAVEDLTLRTCIQMETDQYMSGYRMGDEGPDLIKPEGLASELADIVIRVADMAEWLGIDLDGVVRAKTAYNATRDRLHGRSA